MGTLTVIPGADSTREAIAAELEDAARRVRQMAGRPTAVGIILVSVEDGDGQLYTAHEGRDLLRLMAGCSVLVRRLDSAMVCRDEGPATRGDR
jgi:hypothetical protein